MHTHGRASHGRSVVRLPQEVLGCRAFHVPSPQACARIATAIGRAADPMRSRHHRPLRKMLTGERLDHRLTHALASEWSLQFGASGYEEARSVVATDDGGYVVAGWSNGVHGSRDENVLVAKIAADHGVVWSQTFGGGAQDRGYTVVRVGDGFLVGGMTRSFSSRMQCYLIRLDGSGDVLWEKTYGQRSSSGIRNLCRTSDGGFVATGWSGVRRNDDSNDLLLFKIDAAGELAWWREYAEPLWQLGHEVVEAADCGFLVAGIARRHRGGRSLHDLDGRITKTNAVGDIEWARQTFQRGWDEWHGVTVTSDGCVVSGGVMAGGIGRTQMMRIDAAGSVVWQRVFATYGYSWHVTKSGANGFVAVGAVNAPSNVMQGRRQWHRSTFVLIVDGNGGVIEGGYYGSRFHDEARYVLPAASNRFVVVGYIGNRPGIAPRSNRQPAWDRDVWIYEVSWCPIA